MDKIIMSIFAHQDDETFSAGGVLASHGKNAYAVCITFDPKREKEFLDACELLGINAVQLNFKHINALTEAGIREELMQILREVRPKTVITHLDFDYHHEHRYTRKIVEEVIEWVSHTTNPKLHAHQVDELYAAETTVMIPVPDIFVDITEYNSKRLKAIQSYESQSHKGGDGFYGKFHNTRTQLRGIQASVEHAEAFLKIPIATVGAFKPVKYLEKI